MASSSCSRIPFIAKKTKLGGVKRRVLLGLGYVGSGYSGNTYQWDNPCISTVEEELLDSLKKSNLVAIDNVHRRDVHRQLGWSRTSRTDKGVHASLTFASLKIRVPSDDYFCHTSGYLSSNVVNELNHRLPNDIKIFSCVRVRRKFCARRNCSSRSYKYFVPAQVLSSSLDIEQAGDSVISKFDVALKQFEGTHQFHNYTSNKASYDFIGHSRSSGTGNAKLQINMVKDSPEMIGTIYKCKRSPHVIQIGEQQFFEVNIVGKGFIYNQIRKIIGTAVASATRRISEEYVRLTLSRLALFTPLAPPEGLVLTSCSFIPANNLLVNREQGLDVLGINFDSGMFDGTKRAPLRYALDLQSTKEMETFNKDYILTKVEDELPEAMGKWEKVLNESAMSDSAARHSLSYFEAHQLENKQRYANYSSKEKIPNGLHTQLAVHFDRLPGLYVKDALEAIKSDIMDGAIKLKESTSHQEACMDIIHAINHRGLEHYSSIGYDRRTNFEKY